MLRISRFPKILPDKGLYYQVKRRRNAQTPHCQPFGPTGILWAQPLCYYVTFEQYTHTSRAPTRTDARGDVFRGLEVVEQACGAGVAMMGETLGGVANGVDTYSYREPLGVCAGVSIYCLRSGQLYSYLSFACYRCAKQLLAHGCLGNCFVLKPLRMRAAGCAIAQKTSPVASLSDFRATYLCLALRKAARKVLFLVF